MNIDAVIAADSFFKDKKGLELKPLDGGFSNETHIVTWGSQKYVVKINFSQSDYLNATRETEMAAQSRAAAMGIAPKVLSNCNEYSISEFVEGHLMEHDEIVDINIIMQIAELLRKIHSIKGIERSCSAFDLIDGYVHGISKFNLKLPEGFTDILKKTDEIRNRRSMDKQNNNKYCHNDVLGNNLLYDGVKITLIDWELSGIGDPYMDLASLPYSSNFSEENEKLLLKEYFGYYETDMSYILKDMKYVGMVREVVWALYYAGLNRKSVNHNFNYYEAAKYVIGRLNNGYFYL